MTSTDTQVFVTWQDACNGSALTGAEDVYFSSIKVAGTVPTTGDDDGAPGAILFGAGLLVGAGVATALAAAVARKTANSPATTTATSASSTA